MWGGMFPNEKVWALATPRQLSHAWNIFCNCTSYIHIQVCHPPKKLPVCLKHSWTDCVFFKTTHPKTPMGSPPLGPAQWPDHSWSRGWRPRPEERPETKDCAWSQQENTNKTAWWLLLPPLKNDGVSNSWDYDIPNIWKNTIHVPNHQPVMDAGRFHQMEDPTWSKPTESFFSVEV